MTLRNSLQMLSSALKSAAGSTTAKAFASALLISPIPLIAMTTDVPAQVNINVSVGAGVGFNRFYDDLAPYGTWHHHPRWGDVWRPRPIGGEFRPYQRGHWEYTIQYGWLWASDDPYGDVVFHYGRWVYDPFDGWLWIPGYVWGPGWVVWRSGGGYTGWFPMPPDDGFLYGGGDPYYNRWDNWNVGFGYSNWYGPSFNINTSLLSFWMFVPDGRLADRDYIRYAPPRANFINIVNNTTNITNYVTVNNYIVNRSVDVTRIERAAGRRIVAVEARNVLRQNASITRVDEGSRIQLDERRQHGGNRNASASERIVALPAARARGGQGGGGIGRGNDAIRGNDRGNDNELRGGGGGGGGRNNGPNIGNGPDRDRGGDRDRGNDRRGGPNALGQGGGGGGGAPALRERDSGPGGGGGGGQPRGARGPQNEGPAQGGGGANNRRNNQDSDANDKRGGGGNDREKGSGKEREKGGGNEREKGGGNRR